MWISPNHRVEDFSQPYSIDDLITIYEDRVRGWFLDIADKLTENVAADFATLMIVTAFFEGHAIYLEGKDSKDRSREAFKVGFKEVMRSQWTGSEKDLDATADMLWAQVRIGLFHTGMVYSQVGLFRGTETEEHPPVKIYPGSELMPGLKEPDYLVLNALKLLKIVQEYFGKYIACLRDPNNSQERENFRKGWEICHKTRSQ